MSRGSPGRSSAATAPRRPGPITLEEVVIPSSCLGGPPDVDTHISILSAMYPDEGWTPAATCRNRSCRHELSAWEVLAGFSDDPGEVTTCCPKCSTRFPASLASTRVRVAPKPLICGIQLAHVLAHQPGISAVSFDALARQWPHVVASARWHFGSVALAFAAVGVAYNGERDYNLAVLLKRIGQEIDPSIIAQHLGLEEPEVRHLIAS